jgi:tRNA U34 5-methylaminomethyl-2-thiouridine-forming methyltransferase MnmC
MAAIKVITTGDGSHSLLNEALQETYHSKHGALQESMHVFIQHGFRAYLDKMKVSSVKILEVGFGTGLNALLTLREVSSSLSVHYTSVEAFPLSKEIWSVLNYAEALGMSDDFVRLHEASWDEDNKINSGFTLLKKHTTLELLEVQPQNYNVVFFDAFAPNKQPELWTYSLLEKVAGGLVSGGVFVTYCAKGQLKRDLKTLGLMVETLPGPPGKKEMVRAWRN